MKIPYLIFVVTLLLFTSCEDDFLSVEENVNNIPSSTAPTIEAFICPQDTLIKVKLNYTRPIVGTSIYQVWLANVSKAIVTITDGTKTATFDKPEGNVSSTFTLNVKFFKIEAGKTYTLKVINYDGQQAEATCTIPLNSVDLKKVTVQEIGIGELGGKKYIINWDDIPNEENYYSIYVLDKTYSPGVGGEFYVYVGSEYSEHSITDLNNDGKRLSSTKSFYLQKRRDEYYGGYSFNEIQVLNTDIHYYRYHKDLAENAFTQDNPFAEPIKIYSNIKGGFGIFAGYNRTSGIY
ncbi:DUF4249 domain-containing protein [Arcicella sp. DC2W]|uniref:DUF4249 domain-containing protein n=1 Tax=Arcicella gelida TaxID=2984195 RepID=A0ABU5SAQ5_9BACT|nr:DUF4249 domain-containing protein [Arcicella sp. DC2W]MEA5405541.1 DUF4249 domain-containing protein [Arcicella sp. DC2W]